MTATVSVLIYEHGEPCQWLDTDTNLWRNGNIFGNRIFYGGEQIFVISYWDYDKDDIAYTIVKRSEMRLK